VSIRHALFLCVLLVLTSVRNKNSIVRSENGVVVRSSMDLVPLYSVVTGEVIPDCPRTLGDLESLPGMSFHLWSACVIVIMVFSSS